MRNWRDRVASIPDFTRMSEEDLKSWFNSYKPAGSGALGAGATICRLILDICKLRGIDTTSWMIGG